MAADTQEVSRRPLGLRTLIPFTIITFGIAWGVIGLYVAVPEVMVDLFGQISGSHPLFYLAVWSPAIAACCLVARAAGPGGLRRFLRRARIWRAPLAWHAFIVAGVPLVFLAGAALKGSLWVDPALYKSVASLVGVLAMAAIKGPVEEFGWRGMALPLLQRRLAPVWAGLILGVIWGFWHLPAFLLSGTQQSEWSFAPFFVGCIALSIIVTSLFNASRGSILLSAVFHFALMNPILPDAQPWDTYLFVVVAAAVLWMDRKAMFRRQGAVTVVIPTDGMSFSGLEAGEAKPGRIVDRLPVDELSYPLKEADAAMHVTTSPSDTRISSADTPRPRLVSTARRIFGRTVLLVAMTAGLAAAPVRAGGWQFSAGAGVMGEGVYTGSDDHYVVPVPAFEAVYDAGSISYTISLTEGLGVTWMDPDRGVLASLTLNAGQERNRDEYSVAGFGIGHSSRTLRLLEQTPNLSTPATVGASLGYITPIGLLGLAVGYHPTTVESATAGVADRVAHGYRASLTYMVEVPVSRRLSAAGLLGVELMDGAYAEAWYGVDEPTPALPAHSAGAGLRDAQVAVQLTYNLSERVGVSLVAADLILLGDARKSPYTVDRVARSVSLETSFRF